MKGIKRIFFIVIFFGIIILIKNSNVQAASANLAATTTQPKPGQTVTVTATITAGAWNVKLSGNGQSKTIYGYTNVNGNSTGTDKISFTAGAAGTKYTFSLIGGMTDINSSSEEAVNKSIVIQVVADNNGGNSGGSSNGGGSSSSSNNNSGGSSNGGGSSSTTPNNGGSANGGSSSSSTSNNGGSSSSSVSNNANLSNLGLTTYDFKGFRAAVTSYNVTVPNHVTSVQVYASVQASGAKYSVSGNTNLQVGTNPVRVTVTAPDGKTKKTYTIYVARQADNNSEKVIPNVIEEKTEEQKEEKTEEQKEEESEEEEKLGLLSIAIDEKYEIYLEPEFKSDIYEYVINLTEDIDSIPLTAIANKENAEVIILGNEDLGEGENIITIEVKDKETEETVSYTVKVNKMLSEEEKSEEEQQEEENPVISFFKANWMIIAIISVFILVVIVLIVIKVKHNK